MPALQRIAEMAALPDDWDSEGADPISPVAVAKACVLIQAVAESAQRERGRFAIPLTSSPLPDGGLQVEWQGPGARIDVEIAPDGTFDYMVKHLDGRADRYEVARAVMLDGLVKRIDAVLGG